MMMDMVIVQVVFMIAQVCVMGLQLWMSAVFVVEMVQHALQDVLIRTQAIIILMP